MNTEIMSDWLRWFDNQMEGRKVVLLMDNFSAHIATVDELSPPLRKHAGALATAKHDE